ncbi:PH domain-containing protein [Tenacibaculum pacificus]|uniref:PH domain-containing protein n=1 Tax=Tenacibaculum pacificus TaxID=3018314 RepID=UPI0022F38192|nr:PH domain-containing protein [Tenacibaculum pacificus]WBX72867.1 PH domain-containing protein [Tenacibaculum pacificus]
MKNCIICEKELTILNKSPFGNKTKDGDKICTNCVRNYSFGKDKEMLILFSKVKKHSTNEFLNKFQSLNKPLNAIIEKIKRLNPNITDKSEIKELPNILTNSEEIEKIDAGFLSNGKGFTGNGLLVATNYRLIFIDKPTIGFGIKMEDFPYNKISSVSIETGILKSQLKLICSGNTAKINLINGAKEFSEFIRNKTLSEKGKFRNNNDILKQIEKLSELKEKRILTELEFETKKTELLEKL